MPFMPLHTVRLHYRRAGQGPRLLYVSGSGSDLRVTPGVFESPLANGFDLLAYDQRGLGQSEKPAGPYSMCDYADDAAELLDALGWADALVIGVSFGGMVAQEIALRHPHKVTRLVLACTSAGGAGGASYPLHELADLPLDERTLRQFSIGDVRRTTQWQRTHPDVVERVIAWGRAAARVGADDPARDAGAALQLDARRRHDSWDRLGQLDMPVLLCAGRYDGIAPPRNMAAMAAAIAGSELRVYEGGHLFLAQDRSAYREIAGWLVR